MIEVLFSLFFRGVSWHCLKSSRSLSSTCFALVFRPPYQHGTILEKLRAETHPQPTVAKVSKILLAAGLVETQRGVRGGYRLKKTLAGVSLVEVVEAVEGPIIVNDCVNGAKDPCAVKDCCCMSLGMRATCQ